MGKYFSSDVNQWPWLGVPLSEVEQAFLIPEATRKTFHALDKEISDLPLAEAITSPSQYIRECRKWFESRKNK